MNRDRAGDKGEKRSKGNKQFARKNARELWHPQAGHYGEYMENNDVGS
jgi:hypothetical protein